MSTKNDARFERTATTHGPTPSTRQHLGTDGEGFDHVLRRDWAAVVRYDRGGRIERITDLDDPDAQLDQRLAHYWEFVSESIGWDDLQFLPIHRVFNA